LQRQLKSGMDDVKSDLPNSEFLTDVPSHSFHDEQPKIAGDSQDPASPGGDVSLPADNKEKP
jgi:hypothetical protein